MKKRLFIVGAGGFGRQMETYLDLIPEHDRDWELEGYIDDNDDALRNKVSNHKVLGNTNTFKFKENDLALIAIADIKNKIRVVEQLRNKVQFYSYISDSTLIGYNVKMGEGVIVCPGVKLGSNLEIGDFTLINLDSIVGHDSKVGDFCSIMTHVDIGGGSLIEDEIFMGTKATISPGIKITSKSHLGVGAIVIKDVVQSGTYFGNPARRML